MMHNPDGKVKYPSQLAHRQRLARATKRTDATPGVGRGTDRGGDGPEPAVSAGGEPWPPSWPRRAGGDPAPGVGLPDADGGHGAGDAVVVPDHGEVVDSTKADLEQMADDLRAKGPHRRDPHPGRRGRRRALRRRRDGRADLIVVGNKRMKGAARLLGQRSQPGGPQGTCSVLIAHRRSSRGRSSGRRRRSARAAAHNARYVKSAVATSGRAAARIHVERLPEVLLVLRLCQVPLDVLDGGLEHVELVAQLVERLARDDQLRLAEAELVPPAPGDVGRLAACLRQNTCGRPGPGADRQHPPAPPAPPLVAPIPS